MSIFLSTTDKETAETLKKEGFELIEDSSDRYVFLNNVGKFAVSKVKKSKCTQTDRICV